MDPTERFVTLSDDRKQIEILIGQRRIVFDSARPGGFTDAHVQAV